MTYQPPTCMLGKNIEIFHAYLNSISLCYSSMPLQISTINHIKSNSVFEKKATQFRNPQITRNSEAVDTDKFNKFSS